MTQPENNSAFHLDAPSTGYCGRNILRDLDCMEATLAAYEQAIQLAPCEPSFYYHKAHVLEKMGRLAEAKRAYEQAQRLDIMGSLIINPNLRSRPEEVGDTHLFRP